MFVVLLVSLGVLALLDTTSSLLLPASVRCNGWLRTCQMVNPTIPSPRSQVLQSAQTGKPRITTASPVAAVRAPAPTGTLLSSLKTGAKLQGFVASSTPHAAFINAGVVRQSKGGSVTNVNGMLHKSDISPSLLHTLRTLQPAGPRKGAEIPGLLEKNTPVTVYVKEVYKQSGRYTLSTDSSIQKADVVEEHERTRLEANERRRSRRLRRQLEDVAAGTTVTGYVQKVIKEGVLVTITSLGPIEVSGLIRKSDLPEQFQVPPGMKETFQAQLLQQDFIPGREVTCGVLQVHPSPSSALVYNVKLMFEEFGEVPSADVDFEDKFDTMTEREKDAIITNRKFFGAEEDEEEMDAADDEEEGEDTEEVDFEDDFGDYDAEVKEVYEELLANSADGTAQAKKELLVRDLYDWEAVQDMIASGSVSKRDVDEAVRSAGAKLGGALSLEQFDAVVSFLQDCIEGNMQGSSDGEGAMRMSGGGLGETLESRSSSNNRSGADPEEETEAEDEFDDADFEAAQEAFDSLKGADGRVTVAKFKAWEDVQAIIEVGAISEETLDIIIKEVVPAASADGAKGKKGKKAASMDFEQFSELLMHLDEAAGMHADAGDGEDGDRGGSSSDDEDASEDEAEREALRKEIFEEMANAKGKVPVKDFLAWDEITELVDDGDLDAAALRAMVKEVGSSTSGALDYDQFCDMLSMIEEATADLDAPDEEGEEPGQVGQRRSDESMTAPANSAARVARSVDEREADRDTAEDAEGDDEPTDEELDEMARLVFAELLPAGKTLLPVKSLLAWDGIKDEIAAGALTKADVARVIKEVDLKGSGLLDFDQFLGVMDAVEEILEASMDDEEDGDDPAPSPVKNSPGKQAPALKQPPALPKSSGEGPKGFGKNPVSASKTSTKNKTGGAESEIEQLTADLYKELKGKAKVLTVESFENWSELQELLESGAIKHSALERALAQVGARATGTLTQQQFGALLDIIQEKLEVANLDTAALEEGLARANAREESSRSKVKSSDKNRLSNDKMVPAPAEDTELELDDFDLTDAGDDSEEDEDAEYEDSEGEELSEEEAAREIYDELRGNKASATVGDFLQWEDVVELLEVGALSRDDLAKAMSSAEVDVQSGNASDLSFPVFFDLIQIIDEYVDRSKLSHGQDDVVFEQRVTALGVDDAAAVKKIMDDFNAKRKGAAASDARISYQQADGKLHQGDAALDAMARDSEEMEESDASSDEEILEMFQELSKGKDFIPLKALRKWDELQGLVEAELLTQDVLDSYFAHLDVKDGKVDLPAFRAFVEMLDTVLVDEQGTVLGMDDLHRAVDLEGVEEA